MAFLQENLSTILVGLIVLAVFVLIVRKAILDKKKGKGGCSCGCGSCEGGCPFSGAAVEAAVEAEQERERA